MDESCAGDEVLRGKVEELLAAHRQSGSFIATPRATLTTSILEDGETDLLIGQTIGHYRILNRISAGGMGTVYLGERADQQYEKKVAIKLIKRGMDTDSVLRRFRVTQGAGAMLPISRAILRRYPASLGSGAGGCAQGHAHLPGCEIGPAESDFDRRGYRASSIRTCCRLVTAAAIRCSAKKSGTREEHWSVAGQKRR